MALTDNCDVFASLSEDSFNKVVRNIQRQRPSLFNHGTRSFVATPRLMCHDIEVADRLPASQPRVKLEPGIPVPGTGGAWAMEWCTQLAKLKLDFHPGQIALPPELSPPLAKQKFALEIEVCGGIACPSPELLKRLGEAEADNYPPIDPKAAMRGDKRAQQLPRREPQLVPVDHKRIHCFCLELFAVASFRRDNGTSGPLLAVDLEGLEIVDIKPDGMEDSIECLVAATISLGVLPRLRIALDDLILSLGQFGALTIGFTPISAKVPFNPSVANDQLSVFVDVDLS